MKCFKENKYLLLSTRELIAEIKKYTKEHVNNDSVKMMIAAAKKLEELEDDCK